MRRGEERREGGRRDKGKTKEIGSRDMRIRKEKRKGGGEEG